MAGASAAAADTVRVAAWNAALARTGPGLLLRDIAGDDSGDVDRAVAAIAAVSPDILLITGFDYDAGLVAARAFADRLGNAGAVYGALFARRPNTGRQTGLDLDGDGRTGGPGDAIGFGSFAGQGGMVILSRFPVDAAGAVDLSGLLWADMPGNLMTPGEKREVAAALPLSSIGHWIVPVQIAPDWRLDLLVWHAGTPAFDGPDRRNARRNRDENALWLRYLDGALAPGPPTGDFVLMGTSNLDPVDGLGDHTVMQALLHHPALQDPLPKSRGAVVAAAAQGGVNATQAGDPALDTADWRDRGGPGNLRVGYVLPSRSLRVVATGVNWPAPDEAGAEALAGRDPDVSWHGIVWADIGR